MSFAGTHTPKKGESRKKQKYTVPMVNGKYLLTPEQEKEFIRLYPITMNPDLMGIFGISFSTLQRFKRQYGLKKDMKVIKHKQAVMIKRLCERNGYYDSMRGKPLSPQCRAAADALRASGFHPLTHLKETNPRRYKALQKKRSVRRTEQMKQERRRADMGLSQRTNLHLPQFKFTKRQVNHRYHAYVRGYILGDKREKFGERYTIFFDKDTDRSVLFERNLIKDGFTIKELPKQPKKKHYEQTSPFSTQECYTEEKRGNGESRNGKGYCFICC